MPLRYFANCIAKGTNGHAFQHHGSLSVLLMWLGAVDRVRGQSVSEIPFKVHVLIKSDQLERPRRMISKRLAYDYCWYYVNLTVSAVLSSPHSIKNEKRNIKPSIKSVSNSKDFHRLLCTFNSWPKTWKDISYIEQKQRWGDHGHSKVPWVKNTTCLSWKCTFSNRYINPQEPDSDWLFVGKDYFFCRGGHSARQRRPKKKSVSDGQLDTQRPLALTALDIWTQITTSLVSEKVGTRKVYGRYACKMAAIDFWRWE